MEGERGGEATSFAGDGSGPRRGVKKPGGSSGARLKPNTGSLLSATLNNPPMRGNLTLACV